MNTDTGEIRMEFTLAPMEHLKNLMVLTQKLLKEQSLAPRDLAAVAASAGPGSFTGIRIGVSSARAVAQALNVPCVSVPTLEMFRLIADGEHPLAVIFNARRGQVYGAVYGAEGSTVMEPGPYMLTDVLDVIRERDLKDVIFYGDGIDAYGDQLWAYEWAPKEQRYQNAALAARFAAQKLAEGGTCTWEELLPLYMRRTEAEQRLEDGSLARARAAKMAKFRNM